MKSLNNFSAHQIANTEDVKGGTFGCFSLLSCIVPTTCYVPKTTCYTPPKSCYTPPVNSCNNGGYSNNTCAPKPSCTSFSFSFSFGCGR